MSTNAKAIKFLDFKRVVRRHRKEIFSSISRVLNSGWFILGPELLEFEKKFSKQIKVKHVVGVNSGTDAIFLALKVLGVKDGDEVITTPHTATPTISAIRMTGAKPVFIDINEDDLNIDVSKIESAITKKTKAIVPVHLYGYPADMTDIMKVAKKYKLFVVEDACQAHGAKFNGKFVGTIGDVGCFSFYPTKNIGAFGDAGAVITNEKTLADKLIAIRNYGEVSKFNNHFEGVNSRLDEMQAAVLNWGLTKLNFWNKKRAKLAGTYLKELRNLPLKMPLTGNKKINRTWHLFVIQTDKRNELQEFLKNRGIETMVHYPTPVFKQMAYKFLNYKDSDLPVTSRIVSQILSLPLYPELEEWEVLKICSAIKYFFLNKKPR